MVRQPSTTAWLHWISDATGCNRSIQHLPPSMAGCSTLLPVRHATHNGYGSLPLPMHCAERGTKAGGANSPPHRTTPHRIASPVRQGSSPDGDNCQTRVVVVVVGLHQEDARSPLGSKLVGNNALPRARAPACPAGTACLYAPRATRRLPTSPTSPPARTRRESGLTRRRHIAHHRRSRYYIHIVCPLRAMHVRTASWVGLGWLVGPYG